MVSFKTKLRFRYAFQKINNFVRQKYLFAIVVIALLIALGGSFTGFSTYMYQYSKSSEDLTACSSELNSTQLSYGECEGKANALSSSLQSAQVDLSACQSQLATNLTQCLNDKQNLLTENKQASDSLTSCMLIQATTNVTLMTVQLQNQELSSDYNAIVQNSAKIICCMKNAAMKGLGMSTTYSYYYVLNNTINCTDQQSSDLGTQPFTC